MTARDEESMVRTTGKRMAQGMAVLVGVMAVGAAIAVPNWHNFASHPPPVSMITSTQGGWLAVMLLVRQCLQLQFHRVQLPLVF